MGNFHVCEDAFWAYECRRKVLERNEYFILDEKYNFIMIYLDDITMFSRNDEDHLFHLKIVFEKCRKFGISLNPKKLFFGPEEGKFLGHIISKYGI